MTPGNSGMAGPHVSKTFETSDISLASFLRCRGFAFADLKRHGGRISFVFGDSEELKRAVLDYANDSSVPVRSFSNTLRDLKGLTR
jgi:hypothetical protein